MRADFPWIIWAAGWLAIFKALIWLAADPSVPSPLAEYLAVKFLIATLPFLVAGIGVWNLRKWAAWGLTALAAADLLFYIVFPQASQFIAGESFIGLAALLLVFNGPIGDVLLLFAAPVLLKHAGSQGRLRTDVPGDRS
jgi:hypothetical protein